jgi:hypothetical protein
MKMNRIQLRREIFKFLESYIEFLKNDYAKWTSTSTSNASTEVQEQMIRDYANSLVIRQNKEFARVFVRGTVHSFIALQDHGKIKRGDLLRPVTRTKPDESFVRGNVLIGKYDAASWSGI